MAREEKEKKRGFFSKLKDSLTRTRDNISGKVDQLVATYEELDDDFYDELTDILILADVGVKTSTLVVDRLKAEAREKKIGDPKQVKQMLKDILIDMMKDTDLRFPSPTVLMVIGVNGVGKTTTIGKLAVRFQYIGRKVIICAGDTFRAAAADQLEIWLSAPTPRSFASTRAPIPRRCCSTPYRLRARARRMCLSSIPPAACTTRPPHGRTQEDGPRRRARVARGRIPHAAGRRRHTAKTASNRRACSRTSPSSTA